MSRLSRAPLALLILLAATGACGRDGNAEFERRLAAERAETEKVRAGYEERIRGLEAELQEAVDARVKREEEWLRYTQALSKLSPDSDKAAGSFETVTPAGATTPSAAHVDPSEPADAASPAHPEGTAPDPPIAAAATRRNQEILSSLRALLDVEQVNGYAILEAGALKDGATGPVVLRAFDERGMPVATISADRLRLSGSRAARTVTLVLEQGYERRNGQRTPFEGPVSADGRGAERRIELPQIDPAPWMETLPELFREEDKAAAPDDGRWDLGQVRTALNLLLRQDNTSGWWRIVALGGVQGGTLRDVQLDGLDREGRIERKLFADRMQVLLQEKGVLILLESGAQVRGDSKTPFLEGKYRVFLPRADVEEWRKAGVPGLSDPPERQRPR